MVMYIEAVILNNLLANTFVIVTTLTAVRAQIKWYRVLIAALIGTAFAVAMPYLRFRGLFALKSALAFVMLLVMRRYRGRGSFLKTCAYFFGETFLLGGIVSGLSHLWSDDWLNTVASGFLPAFIAAGGIAVTIATRRVLRSVTLAKRHVRYECDLSIRSGERNVQCAGYRDSGNKLYYHGTKPVMILDKRIAEQLYASDELHKMKQSVSVDTVVGRKELKVVILDSVQVIGQGNKSEMFDIAAAISDVPLNGCGALLHCDM